ncbi:hypothetical protein BT93_K0063 [Corymbia citriodora subsp. variegata]|nr:hypothetical protein BT93_K0063 [Corymbia citriodora subsp. variegata]
MESLSIILSSSSFPFLNHPKTLKPTSSSRPTSLPPPSITTPKDPHFLLLKSHSFPRRSNQAPLCFPLFYLFNSLPCFASEGIVSPTADQVSDRINLESIVVAIDDFFNRNPFFVAGCTFIWLVVIPVVEYYLRKYKYVSAIDAFKKLRDDPSAQLLDIRDRRSLAAMASPDLKYMSKAAVHVQFDEGREDEFSKAVLASFKDPANTVICILDNFDGNSMKVAELLFKNGFKEAYAIKGGVRGEKGWLAIQESLLPPFVHMSPKRKSKQELGMNGAVSQKNGKKAEGSSSDGENQVLDHGNQNEIRVPTQLERTISRSSSPYPNYPDMKPPASPTPSKPRS